MPRPTGDEYAEEYDIQELCLLLSDPEGEGFCEAYREAFGIEPECG
jgi:hypothetical protein